MSTQELLQVAGSAERNIKTIESNLFEIVKKKLTVSDDRFEDPQDNFGIYKSTGGSCLAVMGNVFTPTQPKDFLNAVQTTALDFSNVIDLSKLTFKEMREGRNIAFQIELDPINFKNRAGMKEETEVRLNFSTSYDGSQSNLLNVYTYRQVCSNGMMGWGLETALKVRNTKTASAKIVTYFQEVVEILEKVDDYKKALVALDKINVTQDQINAFVDKVFKFDRENVSTRTINKINKINEAIDLEMSRTGKSMYGLLQGITYYTNHYANNSKHISNEEYVMLKNGMKANHRAQELAFASL